MNAVHHVAFNCRDLAASEKFYAKHFGFRRARVFYAETPDEFLMLRLGSTCIELFQSAAQTDGSSTGEQAVGYKHLAFEVPNLEAAIEALHGDGIATDPIIDCAHILPGLRICFFKDPDGNILELMENWRDATDSDV